MFPKPLSKLEFAAIAALAILVLNVFFDFGVAVSERPVLKWLVSRGLKPQLAAPLAAVQESASGQNEEEILPAGGAVLPVKWGDLGLKMTSVGVIDAGKFVALYAQRGGLSPEERELLYGADNGNLKITAENSGVILNLLWALGLGNKNPILEKGPMMDAAYGGADRFASTGGWTLAKDGVTNHYSRHPFIALTPEQQQIVERVSKNIYRPCCDNPTYFPDCNHGMAMLGLLELMASQGVSEEEMYRVALRVNSYWFPDTYLAIAEYLGSKGASWDKAYPKEILGYDFSSASGYRRILSEIKPQPSRGGGSCGA